MSVDAKTQPMEFNLGFELEFASPIDQNRVADQLRARNHNAQRVDRTNRVWDGTNRVFVTRDGSINCPDTAPHQIEIVTSPRPLNQSIYELGQMLEFITAIKGVTNSSTGLHVGFSFIQPKKQAELDAMKLLYHFPEAELLDMWGRKDNRFCRPLKSNGLIDSLIEAHINNNQLGNTGRMIKSSSISSIIASMRNGEAKYHSVNFIKLAHGYLEFRFMGGTKYHTRVTDIMKSIAAIHNSMTAAIDKERDKEGYEKWLKSLHHRSWKESLRVRKEQLIAYERSVANTRKQVELIEAMLAS